MRVEHRLPDPSTLERLRLLFDVTDDDPMFACYRLGPVQAKALEEDTGYQLVTDGLEFFLEADAED